MRQLTGLTAIFGFVFVMAPGLFADSTTYSVIPNGSEFDYDFTLNNSGATGGTLFDLFLSLPIDISDIDTSTIGTPVGWGDPTGGLLFYGPNASPSTAFIEWSSDFSGLYDVQIGDSLSGFSFESSELITSPITFALNDSTSFDTAQPVSSVPEPVGLLALVGVSLLFAGVRQLLRRF
jgi:hypothetical protein